MWEAFADETRAGLRLFTDAPAVHPVWSDRPGKVFHPTPDDVRRVIAYIEGDPEKAVPVPQNWLFAAPYDGCPDRGA
jgi:hypothetical protein